MKCCCYTIAEVAHELMNKRVNAASSFLPALTVSMGLVLCWRGIHLLILSISHIFGTPHASVSPTLSPLQLIWQAYTLIKRCAPILRSLSGVSTVHGRPVMDSGGTLRWSIHRCQEPPQTCSLLSPILAKKHFRLAQTCSKLAHVEGKKQNKKSLA